MSFRVTLDYFDPNKSDPVFPPLPQRSKFRTKLEMLKLLQGIAFCFFSQESCLLILSARHRFLFLLPLSFPLSQTLQQNLLRELMGYKLCVWFPRYCVLLRADTFSFQSSKQTRSKNLAYFSLPALLKWWVGRQVFAVCWKRSGAVYNC